MAHRDTTTMDPNVRKSLASSTLPFLPYKTRFLPSLPQAANGS
jgi:hypothetical protein